MHAGTEPSQFCLENLTVDPQALSRKATSQPGPYPAKRFNADEWEDWMHWDGATRSHLQRSPSDRSSPGFPGGSVSHESTSPSEAESLPIPPPTPIYRIPTIDETGKELYSPTDARKCASKKRKTSVVAESHEVRSRQPKGQKISHNVIEKRYRTNLNDKIARLRDSVPALKTAFEASQKQRSREDGGESASDDSGSDDKTVLSGLKFNKATVLTKATEYIEQLERANNKLLSENSTLRRRVRDRSDDTRAPKPLYFHANEANATGSRLTSSGRIGSDGPNERPTVSIPSAVPGMIPVAADFQKLRAEAADEPSYAPSMAELENNSANCLSTPGAEDGNDKNERDKKSTDFIDFDTIQGAIPVPEYVRRHRVPISQQQHYAPQSNVSQNSDFGADSFALDDSESSNWWPRNRASKVLLGSLAGLMIMEGLNANADGSTIHNVSGKQGTVHKRGLLPAEFYTESRGFRAQIRQRIIEFAQSPQGKEILPVLYLSVVILGVVFLAFIYLGRNHSKLRRRANSVSSNPERDCHEVQHHSQGREVGEVMKIHITDTEQKYSLIGHTRVARQQGERGRTVLAESYRRLRGCWKILTQGENFNPGSI